MKIMNLSTNRMRCTALALCAFAIGAAPVWAQAAQDTPPPPPAQSDSGAPQGRPGMERVQEHHLEMMIKHLSLTPDQVAQVKAIDQEGKSQMMALHQDTSTPQADKREKMKAIHEGQNAKIRAILTDAQRPKFDAMIAHEHERMERRGGPEGGPNAGPAQPPPPSAL